MGQYYKVLTYGEIDGYTVYDRSVKENEKSEAEYMMAKLMEHSWLGNDFISAFSHVIFENPMRVAWIGDYSKDTHHGIVNPDVLTREKIIDLHQIAWDNREDRSVIKKPFSIENKLLVNWDKECFVMMKEYIETNTRHDKEWDGWCLHPLSLLTAIGNGLGGGDYHGKNMSDVGSWAFDMISFEKRDRLNGFNNMDFQSIEFEFKEE